METADMSDSTVNVNGSDELKNLYQLARSARDSGDDEQAFEYYLEIGKKDPNSWEALLYMFYYPKLLTPTSEILSAGEEVAEFPSVVLNIIKKHVENQDEQIAAVKEVAYRCLSLSEWFFEYGKRIQSEDVRGALRCFTHAYAISLMLGDFIDNRFGDYEELHEESVRAWKDSIEKIRLIDTIFGLPINEGTERTVQECTSQIQKYDSSYQAPPHNVAATDSSSNTKNSDEMENLYQLARQARDNDDNENAHEYYSMIAEKDPTSWEALLYIVYYTMLKSPNSEIESAGEKIIEYSSAIFDTIKNHVENRDEQIVAVKEAAYRFQSLSSDFFHRGGNMIVSERDMAHGICVSAYAIGLMIGNIMDNKFGDYEELHEEIVKMWRFAITYLRLTDSIFDLPVSEYSEKTVQEYTAKIHKYDSSYQPPSAKIKKYDSSYQPPSVRTTTAPNTKSGGCYVATAVYGSYDCPQVWTLRRYRDNTLAETWYGRVFIRTYYAVSPTIVKWFGDTVWFKNLWKGRLDRMVSALQEKGVEGTPYEDKNW